MKKNPIALELSEKQRLAVETLAGGRIVRLSAQVVGDKLSVDFVGCNAPFLACDAHNSASNTTLTGCNAPFLACNDHLTAGKIAFSAAVAPFKKSKNI